MRQKVWRILVILVTVNLMVPGLGWTQNQKSEIDRLLNNGFVLLEQGNYDKAQKVYEELLTKDPAQPMALNNLGAIMVKQGKYDRALDYLRRALPHAQGYKVAIDRVCNVDGICAVCRIKGKEFGSEDLERVVRSNILMLEMARSTKK